MRSHIRRASPTPASDASAAARTIPAMLQQQAARLQDRNFLQIWSPDHGIVCSLSFAGMAARVSLAESLLQSEGIHPGARVAFLAGPSAQFFIYCVAVMGLGGVSVNLNWRQPPSALLEMLRLAASTTLVASAAFQSEATDLESQARLEPLLWLPTGAPADGIAPGRGRWLDALDGELTPAQEQRSQQTRPRSPIDGASTAVIMFTSGSNSSPKVVPLTHEGLLWNCEQKRVMSPELVSAPNAGTLSFLPNFHVIGFTNNFLFNLYAGIRCAVQLGVSALTPRLMLQACADLSPTVVDTVPWVAEEMIMMLEKGRDAQALLRVQYVLAGGAALNEELLLPILRKHGLKLWPHYGQTELGGPALAGGLEGCLSAMRPPPSVQWELVNENGAAAGGEGELVLIGMHCATAGATMAPFVDCAHPQLLIATN